MGDVVNIEDQKFVDNFHEVDLMATELINGLVGHGHPSLNILTLLVYSAVKHERCAGIPRITRIEMQDQFAEMLDALPDEVFKTTKG